MTKAKWEVRHYNSNPRNNNTELCDTKKDAIEEMKLYESDDNDGCSILYRNDAIIARRDWNKKRVSWI
jgi:hypothetical protein